jgi:L-alanine-DL-glutamate epimerase-like enolase superfamily enzyme
MASEITDVAVHLLYAVPQERIAMSFGVLGRRAMALVEIRCSDGSTGYGESWINYPSWAGAERRATITQGVAPLLIGKDPDDVIALHDELVRALAPLGRQWGAPGPISQAISGADIALWDRYGRVLKRPLCELLGGVVRDRVPVYASSLGPTDVAEHAAACREQGFGLVKLKVGFGREVDEANLAAAREALGDRVDLAADANQRWSLDEALDMADALRRAGVVWVEEPIAGSPLSDVEKFYGSTGLPVALGENLYLRSAFEPYIASPAVQVLQPDVSKSGGITELVAICEAAHAAGKTVMPHLYGGALTFAASLQLAACCAAIERVEYDVRSNPLRDPLLRDSPVPVGGILTIPMGPGLGVDLDLAAVQRVAERP